MKKYFFYGLLTGAIIAGSLGLIAFDRLRQESESVLNAFSLSGYAVRISKYQGFLETSDSEIRNRIQGLLCYDGEILLDEIDKNEFDQGYLEITVSKSIEEYTSELKDMLSQCMK